MPRRFKSMGIFSGLSFFSVLFLISHCGAFLTNEHFHVHVGYRVNTAEETLTTKSAPMCAAACSAKNDVTPNTCVTSTFNTVTNECLLSSKGLAEATSGFGAAFKTMSRGAGCICFI